MNCALGGRVSYDSFLRKELKRHARLEYCDLAEAVQLILRSSVTGGHLQNEIQQLIGRLIESLRSAHDDSGVEIYPLRLFNR